MRFRTTNISQANAGRLFVDGDMPSPDRLTIQKLFAEDSERLWSELISPDSHRQTNRQMPLEHWWRHNEGNWMGWHDSANFPELPDEVVPALQRVTNWSEGDFVVYMVDRETTFLTTWCVFLRNWRRFLRMNDEPLLIRPSSNIYVCFGGAGDIGWGFRFVKKTEADIVWQNVVTDVTP